MTESVWADAFLQSGAVCQLLYYMEHHDARDVLPETAYEHEIFISGLNRDAVALREIILQFVDGAGRDGHEALLAPLAFYLDEAFVQVKVGKLEVA